MSLDLLALSVLGVFALIGAWRGAIAAGTAVAALVLGYGAAFVLGPIYGDALAERLGLPLLLGAPVAGAAAFVVTYFLCGIAGALLARWDRLRRLGAPRSVLDRGVGAALGSARGVLVVLLLLVLVGWLDAARDHGAMDGLGAVPEVEDSTAAALGSATLASLAETALGEDDPATGVVIAMLARPSETVEGLQDILDHPALRELQRDRLFWTLLENGASDRALNQGSFWRLSHDADLRESLAAVGVISDEQAESPEAFRVFASEILAEVGPKLKGLREDPELQALAQDPAVLSMVESGNTLGLITHPGVQRLVAHIAETR